MIEIDGAYGEGGGQILRTACTLAAVTRKPCRVVRVRHGRKSPGLKTQHLVGIQALAKLSNAEVEGAELGSQEIVFRPGPITAQKLEIKIPTAGSIPLVLQSLIPAVLTSPAPITIQFMGGATDTPMAPTLDYFQHVFLRILNWMGITIELSVEKRGYYPAGGAQIEIRIEPDQPRPLHLTERAPLTRLHLFSSASEYLKPRRVAERQLEAAENILNTLSVPIERKIKYFPSLTPGCSFCIVGETKNSLLGADALGKVGKKAEVVGEEAAKAFLVEESSAACLDRHMADQILPYLALSKGECAVTASEITLHCRTTLWVIEKFIPGSFQIKDNFIRWIPAIV